MELNKPFKLFANCIAVKGANRSTICDLQRNEVKLIPNDLCLILKKYQGKTINAVKEIYRNEFDSTIEEYFNFLLKNEFIFFTDTPEIFPALSPEWNDPSSINNAILDFSKNSQYELEKVIDQLNELNCRHLEIRFYDSVRPSKIEKILKHIDFIKSSILSVDIIFSFSDKITDQSIQNLLRNHIRIASIKVFNADKNKYVPPVRNRMGYLVYCMENISSHLHCGIISKDFFVVNTKLYTESLHHNSCLNRKISIDVDGNIKNCPSLSQNFGNIKDTSLSAALRHPEFKKYWSIAKDEITTCKDCEFRYICTDCRAYLENPDDKYAKPLKCGYNPYTNKWEQWSKNKLNKKAIEFYRLHEIIN